MEMNNQNYNIDIDIRQSRKTKMKKKRGRRILYTLKAINVVLCSMIFLVVSICLLVLRRPEISETENRALAKFPEFTVKGYFSGEYTAGIENYYNDTVPGRETFKDMVAAIRSCFGLKSDDAKIHGTIITKEEPQEIVTQAVTAAVTDVKTDEIITTTVVEQATEPPVTEEVWDDPNVDGEVSNNILVYKNRGIMLYGGSFSKGQTFAEYLNAYKRDLGDSVNVYSMICPTPVSYYLPEKYSDLSGSEKDNIENINQYLDGVTPVDAYGALLEHKDEDIFARTDHHWFQLGAYYAAEEFAKVADVPFADLESYEEKTLKDYVGTLYGYTGDADLKDNPEDFVYYTPTNSYETEFFTPDLSEVRSGDVVINTDHLDNSSYYLAFLGTDQAVVHVKTDVGNGRKLAIIKDSYGNAVVPCLTGSFEEIYVIDMRYFETNVINYLKEKQVTDLLFALNTFDATGGNYKCVEKLRVQ